MDFAKRKVRFSLEPLDPREVPAQLVALPYPAAPEADIALTAPADLCQGGGASLKIDASLNFSKIEYGRLKIDSTGSADLKLDASQVGGADTGFESLSLNFTKITFAALKVDSTGGADLKLDPSQVAGPSDPVSAEKVQFQDIHFTGKVQVQDLNFTTKVNKSSPGLF
jgi:hypothetical protein